MVRIPAPPLLLRARTRGAERPGWDSNERSSSPWRFGTVAPQVVPEEQWRTQHRQGDEDPHVTGEQVVVLLEGRPGVARDEIAEQELEGNSQTEPQHTDADWSRPGVFKYQTREVNRGNEPNKAISMAGLIWCAVSEDVNGAMTNSGTVAFAMATATVKAQTARACVRPVKRNPVHGPDPVPDSRLEA